MPVVDVRIRTLLRQFVHVCLSCSFSILPLILSASPFLSAFHFSAGKKKISANLPFPSGGKRNPRRLRTIRLFASSGWISANAGEILEPNMLRCYLDAENATLFNDGKPTIDLPMVEGSFF